MKNYLKELVEEAGAKMTDKIEIDGMEITILEIVDCISNYPALIRKSIKQNFELVDRHNGDILKYIKFLGEKMVEATMYCY